MDIINKVYVVYDFMVIYKVVVNFVIVDLLVFYFDFVKDVVYIEVVNSLE